ncbi:MAG: NUDIX hydrolase [bacterium]|nr:NUDIX hydrolase [bacterium]
MTKSTVAAIITKIDNGKEYVLLARRNTEPYKDFWSLPGGHIELNETSAEAVKREVNEEIGLEFDPYFLWYYDEIIPEENIHAVVNIFSGEATGNVKIQKEEISEVNWFTINEALSMNLSFHHNDVLKKYVHTLSPETRNEILTEYSSLREEILKRMDFRNRLETFTLIVAGSIFSFGLIENGPLMLFLIYPVLALFLAVAWMHSDVRIGEIGKYIKGHIENRLQGVGWEKHIDKIKSEQSGRILTNATELSALGIFLGTQLLALTIAFLPSSFSIQNLLNSIQKILIVFIEILILVITYFIVRKRRRKIYISKIIKAIKCKVTTFWLK